MVTKSPASAAPLQKTVNHWQLLAGIMALGLVLRLCALPLAHTTEPDAMSRIVIAWEWLQSPNTGLESAVWLPLHTYVLGATFKIIPEYYYTPTVLSILFAVLTAVPLYWFSYREFGQNSGAAAGVIVATAFMVYPLAFRNSLMALSDTPFALLLAASLPLLSYARAKNGTLWQAALAGAFISLGAGIRYEGWVLIPFMAAVLWRYPKRLLVFGSVAMVVPTLWMIGCLVTHGDPLYSFNYQTHDTAATLSGRGGISLLKRFVRAIFFPGVLGFGLSFPVLGLSLWGVVVALRQRRRQLIWLVPFLGLFLILSYKSVEGTMNLQPRYAIPIGMLLLPFMVLGLEQIPQPKRRLVTVVALIVMLPFSYILHGFRPVLNLLLSDTRMVKRESPASLIEAVPRLSPETLAFANQIAQALEYDTDRLVMLGYGDDITYLTTHAVKLTLDRVCTLEDYTLDNEAFRQRCYRLLEQSQQGVLAIHKPSWPTDIVSKPVGQVAQLGNGQKLLLMVVNETENSVVYRFTVN
ncbi:MAG: ArnT family glycosyltransferase [Leptolyngbyaceae cyanobacterium]